MARHGVEFRFAQFAQVRSKTTRELRIGVVLNRNELRLNLQGFSCQSENPAVNGAPASDTTITSPSAFDFPLPISNKRFDPEVGRT
jgi:hypothetical protein